MILLPLNIITTTLIGASLAGVACSLIGVFVVRMKLSSLGFCMSHAAFAGAALGLALSFNPLLMAMIFSLTSAFLLGPVAEKAKLHPDVILGVMFSLMLALGLIFLSLAPGTAMTSSALGILWGSVLGIGKMDLLQLGIFTGITLGLIVLFFKEFQAIMFSRKLAEASGINTKPFLYVILFLTGITIALTLKLVGGLLIFALVVNPASSVYQFFYDIKKIILVSPLVGVGYCMLGILISLLFDLPVGSSIAIVSSICFGASVVFSPKRKRG